MSSNSYGLGLFSSSPCHCQEWPLNKLFDSWFGDVLSGIVWRWPCQQMTSKLFNSRHRSNIYTAPHCGPLTGASANSALLKVNKRRRRRRGGKLSVWQQESCDELGCFLSFAFVFLAEASETLIGMSSAVVISCNWKSTWVSCQHFSHVTVSWGYYWDRYHRTNT